MCAFVLMVLNAFVVLHVFIYVGVLSVCVCVCLLFTEVMRLCMTPNFSARFFVFQCTLGVFLY